MSFESLNDAGLLAIGLQPEWVDQDAAAADYTGPPSGAASGVYLQDTPVCLLAIALREDVHRRTGRVVIGVADLTTTVYTVTIDGNPVAYDAAVELPADATALIAGIAAKIAADGSAGLIVDAAADPDAPTTTILITGKLQADWSLVAAVAGGTGTISEYNADASSCSARVFFTPGGIIKSGSTGAAAHWMQPIDATWPAVDYRGLLERIQCAGLDRGYVELDTIAGDGSDGGAIVLNVERVMIGPAVLEAT